MTTRRTTHIATTKTASHLKGATLFLIAPFVGLVYMLLLPFVGLALLAWIVAEPMLHRRAVKKALAFARFAATMLAAPLAGLAFFVLFPIVGLVVAVRATLPERAGAPAAA